MLSGAPEPPPVWLAELGWLDPRWEAFDLAVIAGALLAGLAMVGAVRVRRRPLPVWPWLLPGGLVIAACPWGPGTFGVAALCASLAGLAHGLLWLGRPRRPGRPWPALLLLAGGAWLASTGLPWVALAVPGVVLALLAGGRGPGPRSALRTMGPLLLALVAGLAVVAMGQRYHAAPGTWLSWHPLWGAWRHGMGLAALCGVLAVIRDRRSGGVGLLLAGLVLAPNTSRIHGALSADTIPLRQGPTTASQDVFFAPAASPARALADVRPNGFDLGVHVAGRTPWRRRTRALTLQPAPDGLPLQGTVQDLVHRCDQPCGVRRPDASDRFREQR